MTRALRLAHVCVFVVLAGGCSQHDADAPTNQTPTTVSGAATANVSTTVADLIGTAPLGGVLVYQVTVVNAGPDPSLGTTLTGAFTPIVDQLTTPIFASAITNTGSCVVTPATINCQLGDLPVGESVVVTFTATATDLAGASVSWSVDSDTADPSSDDNVATALTPVSAVSADIAVSHQAPPGPSLIGVPTTFIATARQLANVGGGPVTLEWTLDAPEVATVVGASGGCTYTNTSVTCTLAGLAPTTDWPVSVTVEPLTGAPITANAVVTMPGDVNTANNAVAATALSACGGYGTPALGDTTCDGIDDDCDGLIDEDVADIPSGCGVGACASTGVDSCIDGVVQDGCTPAQALAATDETCDGVDDDCDGLVDEDFVGTILGCTGDCGEELVSSCQDGVETTCDSPHLDVTCDGIDNDCDGLTDEDVPTPPTTCGTGACATVGQRTCVDGVWADDCTPDWPLAPNDFTCDGVDDDCDGSTDENFVATSSKCGIGACVTTGTSICEAGVVVPVCTAALPEVSEDSVCNGRDDDCDGSTDEDVPATGLCGLGVCESSGPQSCVNGVLTSACVAGEPLADTDTTCDGVDDDCDGSADDDVTVQFVNCPSSDCEGGVTCVDGQLTGGATDTCGDGIDNDADGLTDCSALECGDAAACGGPTTPLWTHRRSWPLITKRQWERHDLTGTTNEMTTGWQAAPDSFVVADLSGAGEAITFSWSEGDRGGFRLTDNSRREFESFFWPGWSSLGSSYRSDTDVWYHPEAGGSDQVATVISTGTIDWSTTVYDYPNECDDQCDCSHREVHRGDALVFKVNNTAVKPTAEELAAPIPIQSIKVVDAHFVDLEGDNTPELLVVGGAYERFDIDDEAGCAEVAHVSRGEWTTFQFLGTSTSFALPGNFRGAIRGNFDGAFGDDLIIRMEAPNVDRIYYSNGTTTLGSPVSLPDLDDVGNPVDLPFLAGDVDGDGFDDLVRLESQGVLMHRGSAQGLSDSSAPLLAADETASTTSILTDVDDDGDLDLITSGSGLKVYEFDGATQMMASPPETLPLHGPANFLRMTDDDRLLALSGRVLNIFNNVGGVPLHPTALSGSYCGDGVCDGDNGEGCDSCGADCGPCSQCCSRYGKNCTLSDQCLAQNPGKDYCNDSSDNFWGDCPSIASKCGEIACAHPGEY